MNETIAHVSIEQISVNPYQPRREFNEEELDELAASIKSFGIIQPPVVKAIEGSHQFELIAGERRVRAAKKAGLKIIPVLIKTLNTLHSAEAALIENIQRVDLNPIETAKAIKKLMDEFKLRQEEVALKVGKKRSTIANYLRLLTLPEKVQISISKGEITIGHAKAILSMDTPSEQELLFNQILNNHLSVRAAEKISHQLQSAQTSSKPKLARQSDQIEDLIEKLQHVLGTKVKIIDRGNHTGQLCIDYYSLDDLDHILSMFNANFETL